METEPARSLSVPDEPGWPDQPGPYLFVVEVSGPFERRLLDAWMEYHRPDQVAAADVQVAELPTTRRRASRRRHDPALAAFLAADEDALIVPLRVVWLAPDRKGRRTVKPSDLLTFGDPRDPGMLRQYATFSSHPERVRIVRGDPERLPALREAWVSPDLRREGRSFVEEVTRRAWLTLERAERELRGTRYKVPKFPRETLLYSRDFQAGVAKLAREAGTSYNRMAARTRRYVEEIAATHSPYVIDLVTGGFRKLIGKAYVELDYDRDELAGLYQMGQRFPLVFLPTHKSHFDHQSLQFALYENGLPPNHTAGGINMNFFPVGPLIRRSGVFFIRREFKDNEPYKFVLRRYIDYLLQRRFPLEWYIEGARSRTGKLLPPRLGLLAYVVESYLRGSADDVVFVPVAIAYDQIQDVQSYAAEQSGAPKRPETFTWMVRVIGGLRRRYGSIYLRFGAPISLRHFLADLGDAPADADDTRSPAVPKLAFEVANRINEVMPITRISLVTLALLGAKGHSLTSAELRASVRTYAAEVQRRGLPTTTDRPLDDPAVIDEALTELAAHGIVRSTGVGDQAVLEIAPDSLLAAAYYRNMVIHFFVDGAIAELAAAVMVAPGPPDDDPMESRVEALFEKARALRELLLFEFFFAGREEFDGKIASELDERREDWRDRLHAGDAAAVLDAFRPHRSPAILRPFIDAYRVVADLIDEDAFMGSIDEKRLVDRAMVLGRRYVTEGVVASGESVSKILFENAVKLARHRNLFDSAPDIVDRRQAFATEIRSLASRLATLSTQPVAPDPAPQN